MANKKAWEIELDTMQSSIPVILAEEDQGWLASASVAEADNVSNAIKWHSNVPGSAATEHVVIAAMQDMENMGFDVTAAEALIPEGIKALEDKNWSYLSQLTAKAFHLLSVAPKIPEHPYWKYTIYNSYEQYRSAVTFPKYEYDINSKHFETATYFGWLAQICAGAVGTAVEGYVTENIRKVFGEIHDYPRKPNTYNDDITYELAFLKAVEEKGSALTSADIADKWVALIPSGWSAEDVALKNIRLGVYPPESGYRNNPYREWIGAQMRGVICGMIAPADPEGAARLAYMDAVVSHHNNGVLGEIFNAVMASMAYVETDIRTIVEKAIAMIPTDSEYYSVVSFALDSCKKHSDWESAWKPCEKRYERYNWIHAYPNACAEIVALWYGGGEFDETIHISAMEGYDVDCNAAQIASVIAIKNNAPIDHRWTDPIGDDLVTYMRDLQKMTISGLASDTVAAARKYNS